MAKTTTSFTSSTAPKGKGAAKHRKTKIKEAIGLDGWENLCHFIEKEGSNKLKEEILKLKGKDFVMAFSTLIEFVKPKLQRTQIEGKEQSITININGKRVGANN